MHADVDSALIASDAVPRPGERYSALCVGLGGLVVLVGILGLRPDSWLTELVQSRSAVHALFGLLLWGLVAVRFRWWLKSSPPAHALDIRQFCRRLSRMVYLILYLVTGAMEIINILGGPPGDTHPARGLAVLKPTPDGQAFLICGLIALVSIRLLAFWSWRRLARAGGAEPGSVDAVDR
jgi:hypothetical protein